MTLKFGCIGASNFITKIGLLLLLPQSHHLIIGSKLEVCLLSMVWIGLYNVCRTSMSSSLCLKLEHLESLHASAVKKWHKMPLLLPDACNSCSPLNPYLK